MFDQIQPVKSLWVPALADEGEDEASAGDDTMQLGEGVQHGLEREFASGT